MSKTSKIISLLAVLLLAAVAVPFSSVNVANAGGCIPNVWVAPQPLGNDGNPGTQSQPFEHIQTGIGLVCPGGTVHVAAGTYHEILEIDKSLTMIGSGAPTTIIDGDEDGRVLHIAGLGGQTNTISGFTIQNGHIYWGCEGMPVGGGVYVAPGHIVTLNDCTIKNNIADFMGGGVYNAGQITLNRCTVSGNSADMVGGGIANYADIEPPDGDGTDIIVEPQLDGNATMSLVNCTISGNSVLGIMPRLTAGPEELGGMEPFSLGGGVYNGGDASFLNVTIANNTVSISQVFSESNTNFFSIPVAYAVFVPPEPHGGGFANVPLQCTKDEGAPIYSPVATFKNTIVANNVPENGYNDGGLVTSLGHNLDSENTCHFNAAGDLINTDPLLGPLQDNGGPTFTLALLQGSPAINAGDNNGAPATDQRGITRPQGLTVDIGAYELVNPVVAPTQTETHPSYSPPMPNLNRYLNQANMSVQFVSVNPKQATASQPVTISTNVVNTGDESGNLNVELKINGKVEQTRMVSVGPQATQPIKFTVTKDQPGTYSIDIGGQTGSFTIPGAPVNSRAPVSSGLIAVLIVGVLILIAVMVLVLSRRPA